MEDDCDFNMISVVNREMYLYGRRLCLLCPVGTADLRILRNGSVDELRMDHSRTVTWDPGIADSRTILVCYDYLAPGGGCEVLFLPGLSVCVCLSVCVSVCPADILVFYLSAISRDIDLKCIQDSYRVVLNSLKKSRSRSQGRYIAF